MSDIVEISGFRWVDRTSRDLPSFMKVDFTARLAGDIPATATEVTATIRVAIEPSSDYATMEREALKAVAEKLRQVADAADPT